MHGKFTRATARSRGMHGSVANAQQGGRGETLALAHRCHIIRAILGRVVGTLPQGPHKRARIMLKYPMAIIEFSTPASSLLGVSVGVNLRVLKLDF